MASPLKAPGERKLILLSGDGERHEICRNTAKIFRALETMIESLGEENEPVEPIPLPNVSGRVLGRMIAWSEHHSTTSSADAPPTSPLSTEVPVQPASRPKVPKRRQPQLPPPNVMPTPWEKDFLDKNRDELYDLLLAANYLDAKRLMDLLCARVADLIKGKDPATIRKTFHVPEPANNDNEENED